MPGFEEMQSGPPALSQQPKSWLNLEVASKQVKHRILRSQGQGQTCSAGTMHTKRRFNHGWTAVDMDKKPGRLDFLTSPEGDPVSALPKASPCLLIRVHPSSRSLSNCIVLAKRPIWKGGELYRFFTVWRHFFCGQVWVTNAMRDAWYQGFTKTDRKL